MTHWKTKILLNIKFLTEIRKYLPTQLTKCKFNCEISFTVLVTWQVYFRHEEPKYESKFGQNIWFFWNVMKTLFNNSFIWRIKPGTIKNTGSLLNSLSIITWNHIVFKVIPHFILYFIMLFLTKASLEWRYTFELYIYHFYMLPPIVSSEILRFGSTSYNCSPLPPFFKHKCVFHRLHKMSLTWINCHCSVRLSEQPSTLLLK